MEGNRLPCCVLLALSWNTTNENPSTDKLTLCNKLAGGAPNIWKKLDSNPF